MYHILFVHPFVKEHLGFVQFLVITKKVAMNICEQVDLWHYGSSFGFMTTSGIAESWGDLLPIF